MIKTGFWDLFCALSVVGSSREGQWPWLLALGLGCSRAGSPGAGRGGPDPGLFFSFLCAVVTGLGHKTCLVQLFSPIETSLSV